MQPPGPKAIHELIPDYIFVDLCCLDECVHVVLQKEGPKIAKMITILKKNTHIGLITVSSGKKKKKSKWLTKNVVFFPSGYPHLPGSLLSSPYIPVGHMEHPQLGQHALFDSQKGLPSFFLFCFSLQSILVHYDFHEGSGTPIDYN